MSSLLGAASGGAERFVNNVVNSAQFRDLYFFFPKTLVTGLFIGAISCVEGLSVRGAATEIPQVAGRSAVASLTVVSAVTASLSLIIYGTILSIEVF
jgi:ABC-type transporter Mla maintaining outer membrane lipid asymmetry permease subunit MlaE